MPTLVTAQEKSITMPRKGLGCLFKPSKNIVISDSFTGPRIPSTPRLTFSESMLEETIENVEPIITKWDPDSSSYTTIASLFRHDRNEAMEFLESIKDLRRAMDFIISTNMYTDKLVPGQKLMLIAMKRLEKEFYEILSWNRDRLHPESISSWSFNQSSRSSKEIGDGSGEDTERFSDVVMLDLKTIADCMTTSGYGRECVKIYKLMRRSVIDEGLYQLGIEMFKLAVIKKLSWIALDHMIKNWLDAVTAAVEKLFAGERILCENVFSVPGMVRGSIFSEIAKEGAINLLRFPEMVAKTKQSAEKVYRMMDMYELTLKLWPEIEAIFSYEETSVVRLQALSSLVKLGDSIQSVLSEFESTIQKDSSRNSDASIGIHPLTRKVLAFITSLTDYSAILSEILSDHPLPNSFPLPDSYFKSCSPDDASASALSLHLARFILVLLCKLDGKARAYNDPSKSYLFLASNLNYIVETVKTNRLGRLLGQAWVSKHEEKVEQYMSSYVTIAWEKVTSILPESKCAAASVDAVKECFRKFNAAFVEAYQRQTSCVIQDERIREKVKASLLEKLVPSYRHFYETYLVMLRGERNLHLLVKFGPCDIESYITQVFRGNSASAEADSSATPLSHPRGCLPL